MIYRGFTYALRPTAEQEVLFGQFAGVCRLVWNLALEQRRNHWRNYQKRTGNNLNYVTQSRELTILRAECDFVRAGSSSSQQRVLRDLDTAFRRAWKGQGGYPKPKKKGVGDTFSFVGSEITFEKINRRWGRVRLPKIGWVKFRLTRPMKGKICEATITRTALGWQISAGCKINREMPDNGLTVGIDRGVVVPIMLSDSTSYVIPPQIDQLERKYRKAQRITSRRKRGSARWLKAIRRAAKIKAKQTRVRKHWAHESTTDIANRYGGAVIEKLRTKKMTASASGTIAEPGSNVAQKRGLNRAILNVGWHQIEVMLGYKLARLEKINPAYTSQTCSSCGTTDKLSRKNQAVFVCTACGFADNADRNAAINILNRGNTPGVEATSCGACEARTVQVV